MFLGFLVGALSLIKFCQMKQLTHILNILHFNAFNYFEVDNFLCVIHKCILFNMQSNCLL